MRHFLTERTQSDESIDDCSSEEGPSDCAVILVAVGVLDDIGHQKIMNGIGQYQSRCKSNRLIKGLNRFWPFWSSKLRPNEE
jgi:hypothetical protein